jgi:Skp family chaperone for outer membrane proteins
VRISHFVATFAVAIVSLGLAAVSAVAQPPVARPTAPAGGVAPGGVPAAGTAHHGIAVIDVTYILENYTKLKKAMDYYKSQAQQAEDALKRQQETIRKRAEGLKTLAPGSPDYKKLEEELTKAESDWKLEVASKRRDFAEQESTYYLKAYQELSAAVKTYCERTGIQLVLRFNGAPIDPNNREMVQMEVFKLVMYYDERINITEPILQELNRNAGGVAAQPRAPGQPTQQRK